MSWLSSLGTGIIDTAVSTLAGHWSAKQNAKLQKDVWRFQQQNAHQYEVEDLRKAGLNPILSATNSQMAGVSSVSDNGAASAASNAMSSALNATVQRENAKLQAETKSIELDNTAKKIELEALRDGYKLKGSDSFEDIGAGQRRGLENENITADTASKNSAAGLYREQRETEKERQKQIKQDVQNSIDDLKSIVELRKKQGHLTEAQASQAYALASQARQQVKVLLEQEIGERLDNQRLQRILDDPQRELDRYYSQGVLDNSVLREVYRAAKFLKDAVNPFQGASVPLGGTGARGRT